MSTPLSLRIDASYIIMHSCPSIGVKVALFINLSVHQEVELCRNPNRTGGGEVDAAPSGFLNAALKRLKQLN